MLRIAFSFKSGRFVYHPDVHHYRTTSVRIETTRTLPTNVDGELVDQTLVVFTLARESLKVVAPHAPTAAN